MAKYKILHVTAYYPPHLGGQEVAVQDLVNQLKSAGRDVEVVTSNLGSEKGVRTEDGVRIFRLRGIEFAHAVFIFPLPLWLLRHADKRTVVHLHAGQVFTPEVVWLASKFVGFRYIIHLHADFSPSGAAGKILPLYKRIFLNRAIRGASAVVVLSDKDRQQVCEANPKVRNIQVISNGVTKDFFEVPRKQTNDLQRLLFVGRLAPHKNVASLLEAIAMIDSTLGLDIVGDGECRRQLEELVNAKKLSGVKFHGQLPRDTIKHFYSASSAFILPSTVEPQGIVLLEAMACRLPVIVSQASGLADAIRGSGIIVNPTVEGIASGIKEFISMGPDDVREMADAAFRKTQKLSWSSLLDSYVSLYDTAAR
jgi:glycosyltransferase involved in cell wall biosynthesis